MIPVAAPTRGRAWLSAVEELLKAPEQTDYNLILEIAEPMKVDALESRIESEVDALLRAVGKYPLSTVAGTIFPAREYLQFGPRGVFEVYPDEVYPEIESDLQWGAYAHRLVRRPVHDGPPLNPLKTCVDKIKAELATPGPKRACYEVGLLDPALDLPLYDNALDERMHEALPCLSHVSFKIRNRKELLLTVMYRYHWYITKALGNLLGLAQLQAFVCEQTGLSPGPLVCVSTLAKIDTGKGYGLREVTRLLDKIRNG